MNEFSYNSIVVPSTGLTVTSHNATMLGQVIWDGKPVIDDDDGGTAGVREPRRPIPPTQPPAAMTFELDTDLAFTA